MALVDLVCDVQPPTDKDAGPEQLKAIADDDIGYSDIRG